MIGCSGSSVLTTPPSSPSSSSNLSVGVGVVQMPPTPPSVLSMNVADPPTVAVTVLSPTQPSFTTSLPPSAVYAPAFRYQLFIMTNSPMLLQWKTRTTSNKNITKPRFSPQSQFSDYSFSAEVQIQPTMMPTTTTSPVTSSTTAWANAPEFVPKFQAAGQSSQTTPPTTSTTKVSK